MGGGSSSPKYMDEIRIYSNDKEKEKFEINKKDNYHKFFYKILIRTLIFIFVSIIMYILYYKKIRKRKK